MAEIIDNLEAATAVFARRKVQMSSADISALSVLNVRKRELNARLASSRSTLVST